MAKKKKKKMVSNQGSKAAQEARKIKNKVEVGGKVYNSVWAAFDALGLGTAGQSVVFRQKLKEAKSGKLEHEVVKDLKATGKKVMFKLIDAGAEVEVTAGTIGKGEKKAPAKKKAAKKSAKKKAPAAVEGATA